MINNNEQINHLYNKLNELMKKQEEFSREIESLRTEINKLHAYEVTQEVVKEDTKEKLSVAGIHPETPSEDETENYSPESDGIPAQPKSDLEKYIGENLINKIGIAITVIGVAIGAKYSIDHDLISPLTRIILGYLAGAGLLVFGMKLKSKYENYSAVLVSGSMAIMYFITFYAYSFYELIQQIPAFILMVIFTAFTVAAAISYNKQVIAHIGLVGAYAVPFLLSEGSGKVAILFSYMAIINSGILIIAFKKYWKHIYYSSFVLTWLIYLFWYLIRYEATLHFGLALAFASIFFVIFYLTFLSYKLIQKDKFAFENILLLLANSFIFYGIGYTILNNYKTGEELLGLYTLGNALIHFIVSVVVYRQKLADRNLFYLVSGLVLVFITIAIPVQLDGNWVTLLWAAESALLFWIGRTKSVTIYEKLSYLLMILAFVSIIHDWFSVYDYYGKAYDSEITPLLNINFLTSVLVTAAFCFITFLNRNKQYPSAWGSENEVSKIISISIPAILIFLIYNAFRMEIACYWDQLFMNSSLTTESGHYSVQNRNYNLLDLKTIWIINYSLAFVSILSYLNIKLFRSRVLGLTNLGLNAFIITVFLILGLYVLSELRENYIKQTLSQYYYIGPFNLYIRYISFAFAALTLFACRNYLRRDFIKHDLTAAFDFLLHITVLWVLSSELLHWMDLAESAQSYKLGLTILWGVYSMMLIVLGILKKKKYLRIGAILLFGITLIKLFFYDLSYLDTISKTIVFILLGILLLIISFLYNKYRNIISNEIKI